MYSTDANMDEDKTREQLIEELAHVRRRLAEFEAGYACTYESIQQSEDRYRALFEESRDVIYISAREGLILEINKAASELFGYARDELLGMDIHELYADSADRDKFQREIEEKGSLKDYEMRLRRKNGTDIYCLITSTVRHDREGAVLGYQGIIHDITERKQAERALRLSEERFSKVFHSSPDWIAISTLSDGRFIDVNDAFLRITGYSREEVIGHTSDELNLWVDPNERSRMIDMLKERREIRDHEAQFRMKSGDIRTMLRSAELIDLEGEPCMINITRDITGRKQAEEEIRKLNRELEQRILELTETNRELDAFSHSVSHDLRAPLVAIGGFARRLLRKHSDDLDAAGLDMLNTILANVQNMERLINDLLAFSRSGRQRMNLLDVDMEELVSTVFEELRAIVPGRKVHLKAGKLLPAYADPSLIRQVIMNLLSNAFKFTRTREEAVIEAGSRYDGNDVLYYVKDNGVGFDMRYANRLFDVFQRMHGDEGFEGTGIGLSIVQRIVVRHGGRVWAEGSAGKGAVFYFTLPQKRQGD